MTEIKVRIAVGKTRLDNHWVNKDIEWSRVCVRLAQCKRTDETVEEYKAMSRDDKGKTKDRGGFVGGSLIADGPRQNRTVASRSVVTLDIDYAQSNTIGLIEDNLAGTAWCLYSTHSHTPASPRLRLVIPLDRDVTPDEYDPIARRVASWVGMDQFDDSTYESARLMYWPTCPKDGEFIYQNEDGEALSADDLLKSYADWRNIDEWPVSSRVTKLQKGNGKKQEDPIQKKGAVGAFCRAYSISEAIDTYLSDIYKPTSEGRYTYIPGSTSNGVCTYEDKWAYSHHGTDPAGNKLLNAFDLVRIHMFGNLDEGTLEDTPVNRMPSFTAMSNFVAKDATAGLELTSSYVNTSEDFITEDVKDEFNELLASLAKGPNNKPSPSPYNFRLICERDPYLKDTARFDIFRDRKVLTRDLPWAKITPDHKIWNDTDDLGLVDYISQNYNLSGKQAILDAHEFEVKRKPFHPIREYLRGLKWDGVERLDTLMVDYLLADDNKLTRAMTRKAFTAAVARVFEPGVKFDYILTLAGPEGLGKSSIIKTLGMEWFNDSFSASDLGSKEAMEQLIGSWIIEIAELSSYKKNDVASFKHFLTKCEDNFRQAYARQKSYMNRQCVFFATTNESNFLKGDTGNRRFWVVPVGVTNDMPKGDPREIPQKEIDQIWAEACYRYEQKELLYLKDLEKEAKERQESFNEINSDDRIGIIEAFLDKPIPNDWETRSLENRAEYFKTYKVPESMDEFKLRNYISSAEIWNECLHKTNPLRNETKEINQILAKLKWVPCGPIRIADSAYGIQRRFSRPVKPEKKEE